jgi:hypothetical protein
MTEQTPPTLYDRLTIDGLVYAPERSDHTILANDVIEFLKTKGCESTLNIYEPSAESFLVSVPRTDLQAYKDQIAEYKTAFENVQVVDEASDKAYAALADELTLQIEKCKQLDYECTLLSTISKSKQTAIEDQTKKIAALELRAKLKYSPQWTDKILWSVIGAFATVAVFFIIQSLTQ